VPVDRRGYRALLPLSHPNELAVEDDLALQRLFLVMHGRQERRSRPAGGHVSLQMCQVGLLMLQVGLKLRRSAEQRLRVDGQQRLPLADVLAHEHVDAFHLIGDGKGNRHIDAGCHCPLPASVGCDRAPGRGRHSNLAG